LLEIKHFERPPFQIEPRSQREPKGLLAKKRRKEDVIAFR